MGASPVPDLRLQENEKYIKHCGSRFYKGNFYSTGYLYLTDQRLVYHKVVRLLILLLSIVPAAVILLVLRIERGYPVSLAYFTGLMIFTIFKGQTFSRFSFGIPLSDIIGIEKEAIRGKEILSVTKMDGEACRFRVDNPEFWLADVRDAIKKRKTV
jgi:hypothetical protein